MKRSTLALILTALFFSVPGTAQAGYHWSWFHGVEKDNAWYRDDGSKMHLPGSVHGEHGGHSEHFSNVSHDPEIAARDAGSVADMPNVPERDILPGDGHHSHRDDTERDNLDLRTHDDGDLNGDGVPTIGEADEIARLKHDRCKALELEYLFRHGVDKPSELRGMSGCQLWEADAHYHAHLNEPNLPTATSLIMGAAD